MSGVSITPREYRMKFGRMPEHCETLAGYPGHFAKTVNKLDPLGEEMVPEADVLYQDCVEPIEGQSSADRKKRPICRGVLDYFPDAISAVAHASWVGNEQHNPGEELHWAKEKSTDHADCILRHLMDRGTTDSDGVRHTAKVAWRALALLQTEIENERTVG